MPNNDENFHVGHRERLKQNFLDNHLSDGALLELLLTYAIPRRDVRPLARLLEREFGGVFYVFTAPIEELMRVKGIGRNVAILIKLVHQLRVLSHFHQMRETKTFKDSGLLIEYLRANLTGKRVEEMHILYLDKNHMLIEDELHSVGTTNQAVVYTEKIAARMIELHAHYIVVAHNHPFSDNMFSDEDIKISDELYAIAKVLHKEFYDHFLVTKSGIVHSLKNGGWPHRRLLN